MTYTTSMPDWEKRITRRQSIIQKPLFPDTAEQALKIFKNLRIPDKAFAFPEGPATYSAALDNPAAILSAVASSTKVYKSAKEDPISGVA